jgi:hypothetical protein
MDILEKKLRSHRPLEYITGQVKDIYYFDIKFSDTESHKSTYNETSRGTYGNYRNTTSSTTRTKRSDLEFGYVELRLAVFGKEDVFVVVSSEFNNIKALNIGNKVTVIDRLSSVNCLNVEDKSFAKNLKGQKVFERLRIADAIIVHQDETNNQGDIHFDYFNIPSWDYNIETSIAIFLLVCLVIFGAQSAFVQHFYGHTIGNTISNTAIGWTSAIIVVLMNFISNKKVRKRLNHQCELMLALIKKPYSFFNPDIEYDALNQSSTPSQPPIAEDTPFPTGIETSVNSPNVANLNGLYSKHHSRPCNTVSTTEVFRVLDSNIKKSAHKEEYSFRLGHSHDEEIIDVNNRILTSKGTAIVEHSNGDQVEFRYGEKVAELCTPGDYVLYGYSDTFYKEGTKSYRTEEFIYNITRDRIFYFTTCAKTAKFELNLFRPYLKFPIKLFLVLVISSVIMLFALVAIEFIHTIYSRPPHEIFGLSDTETWIIIPIVAVIYTIRWFYRQCKFTARNLRYLKTVTSPIYESLERAKGWYNTIT